MNAIVPLVAAADFFLIIKFVAVLAFVIVSGLSRVWGKAKPPVMGQPRVPRQPQRPPVKGQQPQSARKLSGEVDEFLRRAKQRRESAAPGGVSAAGTMSLSAASPKRPRPTQRPAKPQPAVPRRLADTSIEPNVRDEPVGGQVVAAHVKKHLDTSEFSKRAGHLGDEVQQAVGALQEHLREKFDHHLGSLGDSTQIAAKAQRDAADDAASRAPASSGSLNLAALFADPGSARQAIVLSEILNRPADRW